MAEKLEFDLLVKQNDLSKTLKDASSQANTLSSIFAGAQPKIKALSDEINKTNFKGISDSAKQAGESVGVASDFMEKFKVQALGVTAGQIAFSALTGAINFLKSSIEESVGAFSESEDAVNRLNQSLNLTGSYSKNTSEEVQNFARDLQATSKYSDEAVLSQFNFAKSLGLTTQQSKELTSASINLSAQLGFSLEESTTKLAKTLSGELPRGLKALIPELKTLTQEQLRSGEAAEIINKKYSGSAANELKTYSGSVANLKNSYNDLQEKVGELIVKSSLYQGTLNTLKKFIEGLNSSADAYSVKVLGMAGANAIGSRTAALLKDDISKLDKEIANVKGRIKSEGDFTVIDPIEEAQQSATISRLTIQLNQLAKSRAEIQRQLSTGLVAKPTLETASNIGLTPEQEESLHKAKSAIIRTQEDIVSEKKRIRDQEVIAIITEEEGKREAEIASILEFETRKAEIDAELKERDLSVKLTRSQRDAEILKIAKDKELAILQASGKAESALSEESDKKEKTRKQQATAFELQTLNTRAQYISAFGNLGAALAADGSKAQFLIQKASAIAGSIVATQLGVAQALALGPILGPPLAANMQIIGNINTAAIAATAIKGFEQGGFVGGLNGASVGSDNRVAQVRDGEMILNASQQKNLMDMINAGSGGGDIVIQINEREIARAVRNQTQQGFRLA